MRYFIRAWYKGDEVELQVPPELWDDDASIPFARAITKGYDDVSLFVETGDNARVIWVKGKDA